MKAGVSGIRGEAGAEIDTVSVMGYCTRFSRMARACAIGRDTRPSGRTLYDAACAALAGSGSMVYGYGVCPTPVIFREARKTGAGVIITASHNPLRYNGLKFAINGRGLDGEQMAKMLNNAPQHGAGKIMPSLTDYIADAAKEVGQVSGAPKIAVDAGGGAARGFADVMLQRIGCVVDVVESSRGPDPTQDKLEELAGAQCRLGYAFDLDGDRLVLVINGVKQSPDLTLGLGIASSLRAGGKRFALSIDTSLGVERYAAESGAKVYRCAVGEANVARKIEESGADAGGEGSSGGLIMPRFNWCRDGMLAGGMIARLDEGVLNEAARYMAQYTQMRTVVRAKKQNVREIFESEYSEVVSIDGAKGIIDEDSWVLARESNTEDVVRISAEAKSPERCANILRRAEELVGGG